MDNVYKGGEHEPFQRKQYYPKDSSMDTIKKKINVYFNLAKQIHEYFGYKEDWVTIPMDDQRNSHWLLTDKSVIYSDEPLTTESIKEGKKIYSAKIYTQRFLPKWVYPAEELTMICCDTQCDGNKYLMIFDNAKECKNEELKKSSKVWEEI